MKKISLLYDFLKELGGLERVMFFQANVLSNIYRVSLDFIYVSEKEKQNILHELELKKEIPISAIVSNKAEIVPYIISILFPNRLNNIDADLFISNSFMCSRLALARKKKKGTPYVVIMHHPPNFLYSRSTKGWANNLPRMFAKAAGRLVGPVLKAMDRKAVRGADLVIVSSMHTAKKIEKIYGVKPEVVYPQISSFFKPLPDKEINKFKKSKKIIRPFVLAHGRIIPDKNYLALIPMIAKIKDIDLLISGTISPEYRKELEKSIKENKIENRVKILGRITREDLLGYYNSASLYLMPAPKEDFGLTVVEAIACGCPVIAWGDGAGPNETVTSENGILAKPYEDNSFIDAIGRGLSSKWNRKKVSESVKHFSEKSIRESFLKSIKKVNF